LFILDNNITPCDIFFVHGACWKGYEGVTPKAMLALKTKEIKICSPKGKKLYSTQEPKHHKLTIIKTTM